MGSVTWVANGKPISAIILRLYQISSSHPPTGAQSNMNYECPELFQAFFFNGLVSAK